MSEKDSESIKKKKLQNSLDKLYSIFQENSDNADEISKYRCPYKNVKSKCTANFYCHNQKYIQKDEEIPFCTGSDKLDYRPAWEVDKPIRKNE